MSSQSQGEFIQRDGERYYVIRDVDKLPEFLVSLVSAGDHWLFAGSLGGMTTGRVSPDTALLPYLCVDKLYDTALSSGPRTVIKAQDAQGKAWMWEPFNLEQDGWFSVTRNLYKHALGHVLAYEEINHDLHLRFEYRWQFSDAFGICRHSCVENLSNSERQIEVLDGIQNILPAGTPRFTQTNSSNLVDAYKWTEVDEATGLALYTLYSAITDRAEPAESLRANTLFALGADGAQVHVNANAVAQFKNGTLVARAQQRGVRNAFWLHNTLSMAPSQSKDWWIVADVELDQSRVTTLLQQLNNKPAVLQALLSSLQLNQLALAKIMASADGFQATAEPEVSVHHYANTLFNVLRGGIFANQYLISSKDVIRTLKGFNKAVYSSLAPLLSSLPEWVSIDVLKQKVEQTGDLQALRLVNEYLPITFGRRHGDPSRPWNQFAIQLTDEQGQPLLSYQGNWRDIFQNWEALSLSYPLYITAMIAKFVNASTIDGYNPYRITKQGIDWEVEEPDDPWSYIGYWGDHQIIYLLKLLEMADKVRPQALIELLDQALFSYANVPYRIKPFEALCADPKDTVIYDHALADTIDERVARMGADGKMVLDANGHVYQVRLLEKLLVPLLTKLSNLVLNGGIWLNTQRPEWNDANNALVGQGLSMVTLYYMHRYIVFFVSLIEKSGLAAVSMTAEVVDWYEETAAALQQARTLLAYQGDESQIGANLLLRAGKAACDYRKRMYQHKGGYHQQPLNLEHLLAMLDDSLFLIAHSIKRNLASDGLYHAYNTLSFVNDVPSVGHLYPMLEGQVSVLSSGALSPTEAVALLDNLFNSAIYREDIGTFMLYPDRPQTTFLQKNTVSTSEALQIPLVSRMLEQHDKRILLRDSSGVLRFNSKLINARELRNLWSAIAADYPDAAGQDALDALLSLYEATFNHVQFTGRSNGMFGFEGLGCVYWHMVSKLLLAVQELAIEAHQQQAAEKNALIAHYYRVREGIGFNKTPAQYGAFPTDPYSHTPKHAGAQQPGMTGQVKEELLTRLAELGGFVEEGVVYFDPFMLRACEFSESAHSLRYLDVKQEWHDLTLPANSLAFTWCQTPIVYHLQQDANQRGAEIHYCSGEKALQADRHLSAEASAALLGRTGDIECIHVYVSAKELYASA